MSNRLFAIGDIHGCFDPFKEMVENRIRLTPDDRLVLLGDYIDRGAGSKQVIDYIMNLRSRGFNLITLTGNHEVMLLDALRDDSNLALWIYNGGSPTLESFNVDSVKDLDHKYVNFFRELKYYCSLEDYLFVHAGFNDELNDPFSEIYPMIWRCRREYNHPQLRNKSIVHGHCIVPVNECRKRVAHNPKVIDIDTGCVYTNFPGYGHLTAIELYSMELFSVPAE